MTAGQRDRFTEPRPDMWPDDTPDILKDVLVPDREEMPKPVGPGETEPEWQS